MEEEEDHTYELLLTAQTKIPKPIQESHSSKGKFLTIIQTALFTGLLHSPHSWQDYNRVGVEMYVSRTLLKKPKLSKQSEYIFILTRKRAFKQTRSAVAMSACATHEQTLRVAEERHCM